MISVNATLVVQVIHFLILVFILNRLMLQPLLKLIREREEFTNKTKSEISDLEIKIVQLQEGFLAKENMARKNAGHERSEMVDAALNEAEGFFDESRQEVSGIRTKADEDAKAQILKATPMMRDQAVTLVNDIIEKIIGRRARV